MANKIGISQRARKTRDALEHEEGVEGEDDRVAVRQVTFVPGSQRVGFGAR